MPKKNRNKRSLAIHKKLRQRLWWVFGLAVAAYLVFPMILGDMGLVQYLKMRDTHNKLRTGMQQLSIENQQIKEKIQALRTDPEVIESLARERLGLVRPGEVVFQFNDIKR